MYPDVLVLCPFHLERVGREDNHPSLHISPNGWAYCHGCGWRGRVEEHPELLRDVELREFRGFKPLPDYDAPPLGGAPRDYLLSRGFSEEILKDFHVGGNTDRVWIPVLLRSGKSVGFIFRFLPGSEHKYLYSVGFSKRNYLFGSCQFTPNEGIVCLVEGALDCIRMHQLGLRNTVAVLGDQTTSGQLDLVRLLGYRVVLAFDNDAPGRMATWKVGKSLLQRGHEVFLLEYESSDPGELTSRASLGLQPFLQALLRARIDFHVEIN